MSRFGQAWRLSLPRRRSDSAAASSATEAASHIRPSLEDIGRASPDGRLLPLLALFGSRRRRGRRNTGKWSAPGAEDGSTLVRESHALFVPVLKPSELQGLVASRRRRPTRPVGTATAGDCAQDPKPSGSYAGTWAPTRRSGRRGGQAAVTGSGESQHDGIAAHRTRRHNRGILLRVVGVLMISRHARLTCRSRRIGRRPDPRPGFDVRLRTSRRTPSSPGRSRSCVEGDSYRPTQGSIFLDSNGGQHARAFRHPRHP